jgi:hypothetical protein
LSDHLEASSEVACPMIVNVDEGEGVVKGKDLLTAAMSNACEP